MGHGAQQGAVGARQRCERSQLRVPARHRGEECLPVPHDPRRLRLVESRALRLPYPVFRVHVESGDVVVISQSVHPRRLGGALICLVTRDPTERARAALDACVAAVLAVEVGALPCRQLRLVGGSLPARAHAAVRAAGPSPGPGPAQSTWWASDALFRVAREEREPLPRLRAGRRRRRRRERQRRERRLEFGQRALEARERKRQLRSGPVDFVRSRAGLSRLHHGVEQRGGLGRHLRLLLHRAARAREVLRRRRQPPAPLLLRGLHPALERRQRAAARGPLRSGRRAARCWAVRRSTQEPKRWRCGHQRSSASMHQRTNAFAGPASQRPL